MKRLLSVLAALVCLLGLSVSTYAITIPQTVTAGGVTRVETFNTKDLTETPRKMMLEWTASNRNILLYSSTGEWIFVVVPEGSTISFVEKQQGGLPNMRMYNNGSVKYVKFRLDSDGSGMFNLTTYGTFSSGAYTQLWCVVTGTYFDSTNFVFPDLGVDYLGDFESLELHDNDEVFAGGGGGEEEGGGFWGKIWDWLTSFWEKLKDLIVSLFVPKEGYFDDWFREIKEAFEKKIGGLGAFMDYLKNSFSGMSGSQSGIYIALPDGMIYDGSPGARVNLIDSLKPFLSFLRPILTALIAILTVIKCYRRLAELTHV